MQNKIYLALEAYERLLQKRPDYVPGYIQLGLLCIKLGIISRGIEVLRAALSQRPTQQERLFIRLEIEERKKFIHTHRIGR